jgi:hypothetical protein
MNLTNKKSTRSTLALVLAISVGVHVVGLLIFGVMKIAEVVMREEVAFEAPPPPPPVEEIPEFEVNLEQRNEESSPPRPNPITVDSPDVALPALDIDVNVDSYSSYGRGSGGFGSGTGSGGGIREMAITANLFGTEVTANKLGVVLDISFSTHRSIDKVVTEIDKKFKDAVIILVPGSQIRDFKTAIYPLKDFQMASKKHKFGKFSSQSFAEELRKKNKNFDKIWGRLKTSERGYILFAENPKTGANTVGGANAAMEFLRDEGVDTIYWFADFQDGVLSEPLAKLIESMKRGRIAVIMHDFVAPLGRKDGKTKKQDPKTLKMLQRLADKTDGKLFLKEI